MFVRYKYHNKYNTNIIITNNKGWGEAFNHAREFYMRLTATPQPRLGIHICGFYVISWILQNTILHQICFNFMTSLHLRKNIIWRGKKSINENSLKWWLLNWVKRSYMVQLNFISNYPLVEFHWLIISHLKLRRKGIQNYKKKVNSIYDVILNIR